MTDKVTVTHSAPQWLGLLGIIFVLCKIFSFGPVAEWSWWLVLLPFYAGLAIVVVVLGAGLAIVALTTAGLLLSLPFTHYREKWLQRQRRIKAEKDKVWRALGGK